MKILNIGVGAMIWRLHIMAAIVVILGFLGFLYVGIVIGVALFLLTLMGVPMKNLNPFRYLPQRHEHRWEHGHPVHH